MKLKLAEALLRRKELQNKVSTLSQLNSEKLFEIKVQRKHATESMDDIVAAVPKIKASQITHALDWHSRRLRLVDAAIQQANWTTELDIDESVMGEYVDPELKG